MTQTKITQIEDRSAASAWSPIRAYADVIAIGAKDSGGAGFDETGGELEIYDLQLSESGSSPLFLGSVKTTSRFASLAWTPGTLGGRYPMGMLAGGMENGTVHVWDPQAVMEGTESLIASFSQHASGPVKALRFSTLNPTQLATGGSDGKVLIFHLDQLPDGGVMTPCETNQQKTQITAVAWNTQVGHIVASAAADGTVAVWDLNGRKAWCELRAETSGLAVADLAWNPTQGLHLLTASADDRNPVIKLWDLRASTSMPLTTLPGHQQGVLSMAWCPHDDHLLLSCGKDNRTILWDLFTLKPIAEVPHDVPDQAVEHAAGAQDTFAASGLASSQQRRYDVQWSPIKRGVASTCSLDRKVQAHSILGLASKAGRPPKWMQPASSVSCGFGGSVVACGATDKFVRLRTFVEQPDLAQISNQFETTIASTQVSDFCQARASQATEPGEAQLWAFMQVIFETNARQQLLDTLGFDPDAIAKAAADYAETPTTNGSSAEDKRATKMSKSTEEMVKKTLLVGNFEAAVECCFRTGNLADALILASCGGADLWAKTQQRYFESQSTKLPFLSTVSAIIRNQLDELVQQSDPKHWPETLAILSTYGKSDEFPSLCIALGDLLESAGDTHSASLCYMCSLSLERAVRFWRTQLQAANQKKGDLDIMALHEFVVKVSVFLMAIGQNAQLEAEDADLFSTYAAKLAEQGLLVAAAKYSKGDSLNSKILRDRLYRSKASPGCLAAMGGVAPDFPFSFSDIKKSRGPTIDRAAQQAQSQAAQQQHAAISSASYGQTAAPAVTTTSTDSLPPGWMALQDPSSGLYYYANQSTGEVTWDRPQMAPQPAPAPLPAQIAPQAQQPAATSSRSSTPNRTAALASKYGDGFVTSSSHPELADQYGNVGTSNPYATTARPGTAQVSAPAKAPVSTDFDINKIPDLQPEYQPIKDCLTSLIEALKNLSLVAVDKRLLGEGEKAVAVMLKRLARGEIPEDIGEKLLHMCGYINAYDFRSAQNVQTALVNSDWRDHKDWLKGTKSLLQLSTKKFAQ